MATVFLNVYTNTNGFIEIGHYFLIIQSSRALVLFFLHLLNGDDNNYPTSL